MCEKARSVFHMHRLDSIALNGAGAVARLRGIIHNILDWGCVERSPQFQEVCNQIFAYERANREKRRKQFAEKTHTNTRETER